MIGFASFAAIQLAASNQPMSPPEEPLVCALSTYSATISVPGDSRNLPELPGRIEKITMQIASNGSPTSIEISAQSLPIEMSDSLPPPTLFTIPRPKSYGAKEGFAIFHKHHLLDGTYMAVQYLFSEMRTGNPKVTKTQVQIPLAANSELATRQVGNLDIPSAELMKSKDTVHSFVSTGTCGPNSFETAMKRRQAIVDSALAETVQEQDQ